MPRPVTGVKANRRARAAGLKYGYDYASQGYRNAPEQGASAYALAAYKSRFGARASPTWDTRVVNGVVQYRAKAQNPERVKAYGTGWFDAPELVQRGYNNPNFVAARERYGTGADAWQQFKMQQGADRQFGAQGWTQDPTTGYMVNPQNPGDMRTTDGRRVDPDTMQPLGGDLGGSPRFDPATQTYAPGPEAPTKSGAASFAPTGPVSGATLPGAGGLPGAPAMPGAFSDPTQGFAYHEPGSIGIMGPDGQPYTPPTGTDPYMPGQPTLPSGTRRKQNLRGMTLGTLAGLA